MSCLLGMPRSNPSRIRRCSSASAVSNAPPAHQSKSIDLVQMWRTISAEKCQSKTPFNPAPREMSDPCNVGSGVRFAVRRAVTNPTRPITPESSRQHRFAGEGDLAPGGRRVLVSPNGPRPSSHSELMPINGKSRLLAANEFPSRVTGKHARLSWSLVPAF